MLRISREYLLSGCQFGFVFLFKLYLTIDAHADVFSFSGYNRKSNRTHNPLHTKTTNEPITSTENKQSKMYSPGSRVPWKKE